MILAYAEKNRLPLADVDSSSTYSVDGLMRLDPATRRSLELTQNMADGSRKFTLLGVLDETVTSMGQRLLRRWIEQPLSGPGYDSCQAGGRGPLFGNAMVRGDLRDGMKRLSDLERLVSRASAGLAGPTRPRRPSGIADALPELGSRCGSIGWAESKSCETMMSDHGDLAVLLDKALVRRSSSYLARRRHHVGQGYTTRSSTSSETFRRTVSKISR